MKSHAKNAIGRLAFATGLDSLLLRKVGVVVAFHRVQDGDDAEGLSISRDMFARHCRFFKQHFDVVPLADLVTKLERGEPVDRLLAITFDDGYRDNFVNARPVLQDLSLPATFFVVSRWVGSDAWPWWDREQGVRHPWMTWDQIKHLNEAGFDIGAHTRTHVDLGEIGEAAARDEIFGARHDLERHLRRRIDLFAYPYGRLGNMTESNRALVKAAGFRCCCSCYGGLTPRGADPFRLQRFAVSQWYDTPHQFGMELLREIGAPAAPKGRECSEISAAIGY